MNCSKKSVEEAILNIADLYSIKPNYIALIKSGANLPKIIEMIVYEMFLNEFDSRSCSRDCFISYGIIFNYSKELRTNGFITFK